LQSTRPFFQGEQLERKARRLVGPDTRIVTGQVFQEPCPDVVRFAEVNPHGAIETVNPRGLGRIDQDRLALKSKLAITIFRKTLSLRVCLFDAPGSSRSGVFEEAFHKNDLNHPEKFRLRVESVAELLRFAPRLLLVAGLEQSCLPR
jgi:hypothetical protein